MALRLYTIPDAEALLSIQEGDGDFPFSISLDGSIGGARIYRLYLGNDRAAYYYTNITIQALDSAAIDHTQTGDWSWKLYEKEVPPTEGEWAATSSGNILTLSSGLGSTIVGDAATFLSFWIRVEIPPRQLVQNITTIVLRVSAKENLVGY